MHSDKGDAVRRVTAESKAPGVVVAGDDLGDVSALPQRLTYGLAVAMRYASRWTPRRPPPALMDEADLIVDGSRGLLEFLRLMLDGERLLSDALDQRRAGAGRSRALTAERAAIGNTRAMTAIPPPTPYHRWLGWHAPTMRRTVIVGSSGLIVAAVLPVVRAVGAGAVAGWDVAALAFLQASGQSSSEPTVRTPHSSPDARTKPVAPRPCCWSQRVWPASWCRLRHHSRSEAEWPTSGFAHRRSGANRRAVVDCGQHGLHPAVRRPAFRIRTQASPSATRTDQRDPRTATSPMSPSRSACATRFPTPPSAIA